MNTSADTEHWNRLGSNYRNNWATVTQLRTSDLERDFIVRNIPPTAGCRALDIGVGNGRILERLLAQPNVSEVFGADVAAKMIDDCRTAFGDDPKLKRIALCDVSREPLDAPFDLQYISAVRVLKYLGNWRDLIRDQILPHLAPGGVLVFSMANRQSTKLLSREYAVDYHTTTVKELRRYMESLDTEVLDCDGFARLPDILHRAARSPWSSGMVASVERALARCLGPATLATEAFIAVRKPR